MSRDNWRQPFQSLKDRIKPLQQAGSRLLHANVMTPFHDRDQAEVSIRSLEPSLDGYELLEVIESPTAGCRHHAHYFYGDRKALTFLKGLLSELHTWMRQIPSGVLPKFALPKIANQTAKNLVLWSNVTYALAWKAEAWFLSADVECQEELDESGFFLWKDLRHPPGIDPRRVLTHQDNAASDFKAWAARFRDDSCAVPEYLGAYIRDTGSHLCGDYLRASLAAVDLLFLTAELKKGQVKVRSTKPERRRKNRKTASEDSETNDVLTINANALLHVLLIDHGCNSGNPRNEPFSQSEIQERLIELGTEVSQATVSRAMSKLMSLVKLRPKLVSMAKYKQLCADHDICSALSGIQMQTNRYLERIFKDSREVSDENMERHSDKGH